MEPKQILLLLLSLVPLCTSKCFNEDELEEVANKKLGTLHKQPAEPRVPNISAGCPVGLYRRLPSVSLEDRSLSPWRYVHVTKEDQFPSTYVEAQCLCYGCIQIRDRHHSSPTVVETHDYNSVPIQQTRMFLRREPCLDEQGTRTKYRLTPVYEKVVVGCTCARVKTSS
ncbi:interleukin-17C [Betta splendens]|uniref:Interleukin-17C n=1 Tax=Betta splendens TaxID=158456 RepID=A0A6P7MSB6_BETSP|nr:interleukin-17C [Betta splendens]